MGSNLTGRLVLVLASALALTVSAHPGQEAEHKVQKPQASARSGCAGRHICCRPFLSDRARRHPRTRAGLAGGSSG